MYVYDRLYFMNIFYKLGDWYSTIKYHPHTIKRDFLNATYRKWKLGFNPSDTWELDHTLAKLILPRLKYFRKHNCCHPEYMTAKEWDNELDAMIAAFDLIANEDKYDWRRESDEKKRKKNDRIIKKGLRSFSDNFTGLWW